MNTKDVISGKSFKLFRINAFVLIALALVIVFSVPALADDQDVKRVVVCSITVGFFHDSIPYINKALAEMDEADDRFEVVAWARQPDIEVPQLPRRPRRPAEDAAPVWHERYEKLKAEYEEAVAAWTPEDDERQRQKEAELQEAIRNALSILSPDALREKGVDAVIFNNTYGRLPLPDVDGFIDWVEDGGAYVGIHAASFMLPNEPRVADMLQGKFDTHGPQVEATLHAGDTDHPANAGIGETWHIPREEIYLFEGHDPEKVRTLWYMRHHPNHPDQKGHFPISWCRMAGDGRVFFTSLGHRKDLLSLDPDFQGRVNPVEVARQYRAHLLGGILWALDLEDGLADPNPELE